jgi:hypothetical protein
MSSLSRKFSSPRLAIRLLATAGVLASAALGAPATSVAAECPNQSLREQQAYNYLPDCRGLELASPVLKNGEEVETKGILSTVLPFAAAANGPAVAYLASGGLPGTESAGLYTQYLALGGALQQPWQNVSLNPDAKLAVIEGVGPRSTGEFEYYAPDMSCGVVSSRLPIELPSGEAPGEFIKNLYRWDAADKTYHLLTNARPSFVETDTEVQESSETLELDGATPDCSHVIFESKSDVYAGGPLGALYKADGTGVEIASVLPNGTHVAVSARIGRGEHGSNIGAISEDGSRVFFTALVEAGAQDQFRPGIFMREGGTTIEVSKPQGGPAAQDTGAKFEAASSDGSRVFFIANYGLTATSSSGTEALTQCETANGNGCDLYEYDVESKVLTDLSVDVEASTGDKKGASVPSVVGLSPDGSDVYFTSTGQLVPGKGNTQVKNETVSAKAFGEIGLLNFNLIRTVAVAAGTEGNSIVVKFLGGESKTLGVTTAGKTITVQLATDASSTVTSTGEQVIAAINAEPAAAKLVLADNGLGGTGGSGSALVGEYQLTGGGPPIPEAEVTRGEVNLYHHSGGTNSYVSTIGAVEAGHSPNGKESEPEIDTVASGGEGHGLKFLTARVSTSGDFLLFATRVKVKEFDGTEYNNEDQKAAGHFDWIQYEYSAASGQVTCVSCNPNRSVRPLEFEAAVKGPFTPLAPFVETRNGAMQRFLSDDGRVFFNSYAPLVAQATNSNVNVYEWKPAGLGDCPAANLAGCVAILDSGTDTFPTYVEAASADGSHAYITTHEALVPQDIDGLRDLYDVRVDGGIPAPPGALECSGEECQGPAGGGLAGTGHASENSIAGNLPPGTVVITPPTGGTLGGVKGFTKRMVKGSSVMVTVVAPSAGRVSASGKGLKTAKMSVSKAGSFKLKVALTAKEKKLLAAKRKHKKGVTLTVRISFAPTSGKASTASAKVTFK